MTSNLYGSMDLDSMNLKTEYNEKTTEEYCKNLLVSALTLKAFDVEKEVPTTSSPVQRADVVAHPRIPLPKWDWGYLVFEIKRGGVKIDNNIAQQMQSYANALFRNESGATFSPTAVILFPCRHNLAIGPNFGNAFFDGATLQVFVNGHLILKQRDTQGNMEVFKQAKDVIKQQKTVSTAKSVEQPAQPIAAKSHTTPSIISVRELADLLSTTSDRVITNLRKHGLSLDSGGSWDPKSQTVDRASAMSLIQSKKILQGRSVREQSAIPFSDPISLEQAAEIAHISAEGMDNRIYEHPTWIRRVVVNRNGVKEWIYSRGELEKARLLEPRKTSGRPQKIRVPHDSRLPQSIADDKGLQSDLINLKQAADLLGITHDSLYGRMNYRGLEKFPHVRQSSRTGASEILIPRDTISDLRQKLGLRDDRKHIPPPAQNKVPDFETALNELRQSIAERNKVVDGWAIEFSRRLARLEGSK